VSLFDSFASAAACPACSARGAKKFLWMIKCTNANCSKYDADHAAAYRQSRIIGRAATEVFPHLKGSFDPGWDSINVSYENFRGDQLTYLADRRGIIRKGKHVSLRVAPTGRRIALKLSSIQNRSEVESNLSDVSRPSILERRILNYHLRRGSTSRVFEEIRQKFPDYQP
jgi:hypothetical protein